MGPVDDALAQVAFGELAAASFVQQTGNHPALEQHQRADKQDLRAVFVPRSRLAKVNFAIRRKTALANSPTLQFTPVICRLRIPNRFNSDAAWLFSTKQAYGNGARFLAQRSRSQHGPTKNFFAAER